MTVGIITWMTCMFAVALTMGGPIRRQASQSEKTVPIGGSFTLLCPLPPDDLWMYVYWKKDDRTIYSLEVKSNTSWTNDTRYEGSNHATRLTIKDLKKTDSGVYYCKVATLVFVKERGQVLLSVTDQEVVLSTTSPGVPFGAYMTISPQPAEDNTINLVFLIPVLILIFINIITVCLVLNYRERMKNLRAGFVVAVGRLLQSPKSTSTPVDSDSSQHEIRDKEDTHINFLSSNTLCRDEVNVYDRPVESSNASQALEGTRADSLSSDTYGRDDEDVDEGPEENSNASHALKICKTNDVTI